MGWRSRTINAVNVKDVVGYSDECSDIINANGVNFFENLATEYLVGNRCWETVQERSNDFWDR
jgi:hypothetical protein